MIINISTNELENTINVGRGANSFAVDNNNDLWVACAGFSPDFTETHPDFVPGSLVRIQNEAVAESIEVNRLGISKIETNQSGSTLYFLYGGFGTGPVYEMDVVLKEASLQSFADVLAYGIGVNPENNNVFIANAKDFASSGIIYEYTENGDSLNTFEVGIAPSSFLFK